MPQEKHRSVATLEERWKGPALVAVPPKVRKLEPATSPGTLDDALDAWDAVWLQVRVLPKRWIEHLTERYSARLGTDRARFRTLIREIDYYYVRYRAPNAKGYRWESMRDRDKAWNYAQAVASEGFFVEIYQERGQDYQRLLKRWGDPV